ncbi:hypothetical protein OAO01_05830 [Oligoflexia bacterium]|nr:hypothetical protein [Oligoflexia bacterium]
MNWRIKYIFYSIVWIAVWLGTVLGGAWLLCPQRPNRDDRLCPFLESVLSMVETTFALYTSVTLALIGLLFVVLVRNPSGVTRILVFSAATGGGLLIFALHLFVKTFFGGSNI